MANIFNHTKISFLKNNIIRFEYVPDDKFTSRPTLFVPNKRYDCNAYQVGTVPGSSLYQINYQDLLITFDPLKPIDTVQIYHNNELVYHYVGKSNSGELPIPSKTPFVFLLNDSPRVILPEEGYNPNGEYFVDKHSRDIYLLICRNDFKLLRQQYISLTGMNEMPRIKNFGLFHSHYKRYTEKDVYNLVEKYKKNKIPLDNFVLDTDWRVSLFKAGVGYDVDTKCFPDISRVYRNLHKQNIEVLMNDHPQPIKKGVDVFSLEERTYRYENLTKFLGLGMDYWWYDRNWSTHLYSPSKRLACETLGTHLFNDVTKQFYQSFSLDSEVYTRPVIMSNIVEICNGKYDHLKDSYTHTSTIQWSGDTQGNGHFLAQEIKNMIRCSNNMLGYYSSDIGGHQAVIPKETFIRWYQYGCFSPILRPHCCDIISGRQPWVFGNDTMEIVKKYIYMRYRLLNVLYTSSYKHSFDGLGVIKPLSFNYPNDRKLINNYTSYLFGDNIFVKPIVNEIAKPLTKKNFIGKIKVSYYQMNGKKASKLKDYSIKPTNLMNACEFENGENIKVVYRCKLTFDKDVDLYFSNSFSPMLEYKVYIDDKLTYSNKSFSTLSEYVRKLKKNKQYNVRVESMYIANNVFTFAVNPTKKKFKEKIYLPEGEWYDVTLGNVYQGGRYVKKNYSIEEMPLFVKAGALLPLYSKVDNISKMSLKDICYDFYPSRNVKTHDFFYEDDGKTTGYKVDVCRKNYYDIKFVDNQYIVDLHSSENNLDDDINIRNVMFKMHVRDSEKIESVTINGNNVKFYNHDHHKEAVPFNSTAFALDSKTMNFKFKQDIRKEYQIIIKVK